MPNQPKVSDEVFRALLNWLMVSDPWPLDDADDHTLSNFIDAESVRRGFETWVEAYHEFQRGEGRG